MGVTISLNYGKKKEDYGKEDFLPVVVYYYYTGKKIKLSTTVVVKMKDMIIDIYSDKFDLYKKLMND
jgi:hypothetical protein